MFRSEKLVRITIQVPESDISATTGLLTRLKLLHLIRIDQTHLGRLGYAADIDDRLTSDYAQLLSEIQSLLDALDIPADTSASPEPVIPEKEIYRNRERLGEIQNQIGSVPTEFVRIDREIGQTTSLLQKIELLPADLDLDRLSHCTFVTPVIGLISSQGLDKLEESLSRVHHTVVELNRIPDWSVILIFTLPSDQPIVEQALKGALFEPIAFSTDTPALSPK